MNSSGKLVLAVLLALAAGGAGFWLYSSRIGTAPQPSPVVPSTKPETRPVAAEPSDIPDLVPGQTIEDARKLLGAEAEVFHVDPGDDLPNYVWNPQRYRVLVGTDKAGRILSVKFYYTGTEFRTPDGVLMGRDTPDEVRRKAGDRLILGSERLLSGEGDWVWYLAVRPSAGRGWYGVYSWALREENPKDFALLKSGNHSSASFKTAAVSSFERASTQKSKTTN